MYRLKKYKEGWIVEKLTYKRFLLVFYVKKWKHTTYYSGLMDQPFHYSKPENAIKGFLTDLEWDLAFKYRYNI